MSLTTITLPVGNVRSLARSFLFSEGRTAKLCRMNVYRLPVFSAPESPSLGGYAGLSRV